MKTSRKLVCWVLAVALVGCAAPRCEKLEAHDAAVTKAVTATWPDALVCVESPTKAKVFHAHALFLINYKIVGKQVMLGLIAPETTPDQQQPNKKTNYENTNHP